MVRKRRAIGVAVAVTALLAAGATGCSSSGSGASNAGSEPTNSSATETTTSSAAETPTAAASTSSSTVDHTQGKSYTIRFAVGQAKGTPVSDSAESFKKQVEDATGGRVKVNVYYAGELGSNPSVAEQLHSGTVQMFNVSPGFLAPWYKAAQFTRLPQLFDSEQEAGEFWDGPIGAKEKAGILQNTGIRVLNAESYGFHDLVNRKHAVHGLDDLKGMKFQATSNPIDLAIYKAWGIQPVTMSLSDTYTALQQGVVDGISLGYTSLQAQKQYEVAKYITESNTQYSAGLTMINDKFFSGLSQDDQQLLQEVAKKIEGPERAAEEAATTTAKEYIQQHGGQITMLTDQEKTAFRDSVKPVYDQIGTLLGADAVEWFKELQAAN
jgi:tripartite ATP-independent transporter DctP family solute receptor